MKQDDEGNKNKRKKRMQSPIQQTESRPKKRKGNRQIEEETNGATPRLGDQWKKGAHSLLLQTSSFC
jgi:hypothetical protein